MSSIDDLIYAPISSVDKDYQDRMWQLYLSLFPPEVDFDRILSEMGQITIEYLQSEVFKMLEKHGNPELTDAKQLQDLIDGKLS